MESKKPFDQLYDPHKKAQDAIDHAREVREQRIADRDKSKTEPRLIADGKLLRCSVLTAAKRSGAAPCRLSGTKRQIAAAKRQSKAVLTRRKAANGRRQAD